MSAEFFFFFPFCSLLCLQYLTLESTTECRGNRMETSTWRLQLGRCLATGGPLEATGNAATVSSTFVSVIEKKRIGVPVMAQ